MIRLHRQGFTLIELVVTLAIMGVLASVALPFAELTVKRAKEEELRSALREIRTALDEYKRAVEDGRIFRKADESGYPPSLEMLADGILDIRDPDKRRKLYFLRRIPRDPFHENASAAPASMWGKRSYESPAENPQAGRDVFDVYSRAEGMGINSVPYRQW